MPKIYRVMKALNGMPTIGDGGTDLGVRVPADIQPDTLDNVAPGTGGMSVSPTLTALPPHRLPRRLALIVPRATGKNLYFVWSMGEGMFAADAVATSLRLRPDPANSKHGLVEPDAVMPLPDFQQALEATLHEWRVDEIE